MVKLALLIPVAIVFLAALLRWRKIRRRQRLRESSHARRAERDRRWAETYQPSPDDWRT